MFGIDNCIDDDTIMIISSLNLTWSNAPSLLLVNYMLIDVFPARRMRNPVASILPCTWQGQGAWSSQNCPGRGETKSGHPQFDEEHRPRNLGWWLFPTFLWWSDYSLFFDMFWLTKQGMVMNVYEWLILALSSVTYPLWLLLPHCSALQRSKSMSWMVNPCQSLIISGEIVFFFALAMYDNTPVVLYSTSPHMVSLAQRRSPKVKPGTFDPAPGTVVSRRKWALTWETDGNIKG